MVSPSFTDCPDCPVPSSVQSVPAAGTGLALLLGSDVSLGPVTGGGGDLGPQTTSLGFVPCMFPLPAFLVLSSLPPSCSFTPSPKQVIVP